VVSYVETDHLGTPRVAIDATRNASIWTWDNPASAFGENAPNQDPDADGTAFTLNLRLPGQYYDSESGFNYNYFRDYEPGTGRYVESDPIGLDGGINTYAYANGNPYIYVDSFGLCWLYIQSTGELLHLDSNQYADYYATGGYSGYGPGYNNPAMESVQSLRRGDPAGPIPAQSYSIGRPFHSAHTGPGAMRLTPIGGLNALGRKDLEIHGDNSQYNNTASTGCIIEGPAVRNKIAQSLANDNCLKVVP
jgi:RHS repeat-associated protein